MAHERRTNIHFARSLRRRATYAEALLWRRLRDRQVDGVKFRRQYPIGEYVLDFYSVEHRLALEVDGSQHLSDDMHVA